MIRKLYRKWKYRKLRVLMRKIAFVAGIIQCQKDLATFNNRPQEEIINELKQALRWEITKKPILVMLESLKDVIERDRNHSKP